MAFAGRKPNEPLDRYVDRIIREAQEEGAFDGIGGEGRRLPLTGALDEAWWAKEKLKREKLNDIPDALAIRREAEEVLAGLARESDERVVRERLLALDARIRKINRTTVAGPPTSLAPLDVEAIVARWRAGREGR
jgi:thioredoxin-like negative regulator of GroEL